MVFAFAPRPGGNDMWSPKTGPVNCIVPNYLLRRMLEHSTNRHQRESLLNTLVSGTRLKTQQQFTGMLPSLATTVAGRMRRTIYDAHHSYSESGALVRGEGDAASSDIDVNAAYDNLGTIYEFYRTVYQRNSIDDRGLRLDAVVHYGVDHNNAHWNGRAMVFGDGDGDLFLGFAKSLDVTAHELAHGVTQYTANLDYETQSGALNESFSDIFGSLAKQWSKGQTALDADWLIGDDIFTPGTLGDALRSLKNPGSAYDGDPQPKHMDTFKNLPNTEAGDYGGVHINSGIPNHAFYLLATRLGGSAWETAGHVWYESLKRLWEKAQFQDCANITFGVASELYGADVSQTVREAWDAVGIKVVAATPAKAPTRQAPTKEEPLADLAARISKLEAEIRLLRRGGGNGARVEGAASSRP